MLDLFPETRPLPEIVPARKLLGKVAGAYAALAGRFETQAVEALELTFDGIEAFPDGVVKLRYLAPR